MMNLASTTRLSELFAQLPSGKRRDNLMFAVVAPPIAQVLPLMKTDAEKEQVKELQEIAIDIRDNIVGNEVKIAQGYGLSGERVRELETYLCEVENYGGFTKRARQIVNALAEEIRAISNETEWEAREVQFRQNLLDMFRIGLSNVHTHRDHMACLTMGSLMGYLWVNSWAQNVFQTHGEFSEESLDMLAVQWMMQFSNAAMQQRKGLVDTLKIVVVDNVTAEAVGSMEFVIDEPGTEHDNTSVH